MSARQKRVLIVILMVMGLVVLGSLGAMELLILVIMYGLSTLPGWVLWSALVVGAALVLVGIVMSATGNTFRKRIGLGILLTVLLLAAGPLVMAYLAVFFLVVVGSGRLPPLSPLRGAEPAVALAWLFLVAINSRALIHAFRPS